MSMLYAIAGAMSVWAMHLILQPEPSKIKPTPKPPEEEASNMTKKQLFIQQLLLERAMKRRNVSRRMCKIGWEYHRKYCFRLIPYTFKWNAAKKLCMGYKAQLTMAFSRAYGRNFVIHSMKRFNMSNSYAAVGYYAKVENDLLNYDDLAEITVRNRKDVTNRVKIIRNLRFEGPTVRNIRVAYLHKGRLFWMPNSSYAFPYCEYKRKPEEEPDRWVGYPDKDRPKKKKKEMGLKPIG